MNDLFLFLRTRLAVSATNEPLDALADALPERVELLSFPSGPRNDPWGESETWEDGYVFRLDKVMTPSALADQLKDALALFDAWAIHDGDALCAEGPYPSLVSDYYSRHRGGAIMVGLHVADGARDPDAVYDRVRSALSPHCRPVFHFRDGRILMFPAGIPAPQFWRRVERYARDIKHMAAWDRFGAAYYKRDEAWDLWQPVSLFELDFGAEGDGSSEWDSGEGRE